MTKSGCALALWCSGRDERKTVFADGDLAPAMSPGSPGSVPNDISCGRAGGERHRAQRWNVMGQAMPCVTPLSNAACRPRGVGVLGVGSLNRAWARG